MIKIITVDDHPVIQRGLKQIVDGEPDMQVVAQAENGRDGLRAMREQACDVVILDISLPGVSGIEVLNQIRHERPHLPVLILSMHDEEQYALRAFNAGASGYLMKDSVPEEMIKAIRKIHAGGKYVSPTLSEALLLRIGKDGKTPHENLSDREFQILCMIARGKPLKEIGEALCISGKTVSTYRARILKKMGMKTNADIVNYVLKHGLIA